MSTEMLLSTLTVIMAQGGVYTLMALGLTVVYGITRVFNFAMGSFYVWGGYIAWIFYDGYFQLDYPLVFVITVAIMFGLGLLYERVFIHFLYSSSKFFDWRWTAIIITLGSALFLDNLALQIFGPAARTLPRTFEGVFQIGQVTVSRHDITTLVMAIGIVIMLTLFLNKTRAGRAMRAASQEEIGARMVGVRIDRVFSYTFAIAAVLGGISSMLLIPKTQLFSYSGWPIFCKALVVLVFGGLGSVLGTLIAAFSLAAVEAFVTYSIGAQWSLPVFLGVLIIVLVFRPRGLRGVW